MKMCPWRMCALFFLLAILFISRSESHIENQCVLVSLPFNPPGVVTLTHNNGDVLQLIFFSSELEYSTLVYFVSNLLFSCPRHNINGNQVICSEAIGVIGDLDSKHSF